MTTDTKKVTILAYNGLDGACAAAAALLRFPEAAIITTSAKRVAESLEQLAEEGPDEVHACGLGVHCDWRSLEASAERLTARGTTIHWYCGRCYLNDREELFQRFSSTAFTPSGTNTAAAISTLGLSERSEAGLLSSLAWFDPHLDAPRPAEQRSREQVDWADLVEAAMGQYFKYQDPAPYTNAIRRLSEGCFDTECRAVVEAFRRTGHTYVLHGRSPMTGALRSRIQKCAQANRHVLITGESGVGKEHVAHLLREAGARAEAPFVPVNCALFSGNPGLANSDLFGHLKGAFTGASSARKGRFVEADGGILYLDELGELPLEVQAKLLRVLEDGWVTPEGADAPERRVDVRIVAATNRHLPSLIEEGAFRADLYHRLSTLCIHVPPLRERPGDIRAIARQRLTILEQEGHARTFTEKDHKHLEAYDWPGNVRQLIKLMERSVLLDLPIADVIEEEQELGALGGGGAPELVDHMLPLSAGAIVPIRDIQTRYSRHALGLHQGNIAATAQALGVSPNTLRYSYLTDR
jgi:two-component system, NtrC family, response regulator HydG